MESAFCQRLVRNLGDATKIEVFKWSGKNRFAARKKASAALKEHVKAVSIKYPDDSHFIIAHSHGGNICLQAHLGNRVKGIIFLSTPFIIVQPRDYSEYRFYYLQLTFGSLLLCVIMQTYGYFFNVNTSMGLTIFFAMISSFTTLIPFTWYLEKTVKKAQKIFQDLRTSVPCPILICRASGDEA